MSQFVDEVQTNNRRCGLADSIEKTWMSWIERFIQFQEYQSRDAMTKARKDDTGGFFNHFANNRQLGFDMTLDEIGYSVSLG